jgi:hypothetical protein
MTISWHRPSIGTILGALALFVALGGPATAAKKIKQITGTQIKNNTVASADIKNNTVASADIKDGTIQNKDLAKSAINATTLGKVSTAAQADAATVALTAQNAKTADVANSAGTAGDASKLGGAAASDYVKTSALVTPSFTDATLTNSWTAADPAVPTAAYTKDALGFVHLRGAIKGGASATSALTLPADLRPAKNVTFAVSCFGDDGVVFVEPDGKVSPANVGTANCTTVAFLDGVSFLAGA